jgi:hypothetical protein
MKKMITNDIKNAFNEYYKRHKKGDKSIKNILFLSSFNIWKVTTGCKKHLLLSNDLKNQFMM